MINLQKDSSQPIVNSNLTTSYPLNDAITTKSKNENVSPRSRLISSCVHDYPEKFSDRNKLRRIILRRTHPPTHSMNKGSRVHSRSNQYMKVDTSRPSNLLSLQTIDYDSYHCKCCAKKDEVPRRDRKLSAPGDVISPALSEICSMNLDTSYSAQATSTPSIFYEAGIAADEISFRYDSISNLSETSTMDSQMTYRYKPKPLDLSTKNLKIDGSLNDINNEYDEEDMLTPKILPRSRKNSRDSSSEGGPVFFISDVPNTQPSSQEGKDKIDKAITSGSAYLQLPTAIDRRRHSWMSG